MSLAAVREQKERSKTKGSREVPLEKNTSSRRNSAELKTSTDSRSKAANQRGHGAPLNAKNSCRDSPTPMVTRTKSTSSLGSRDNVSTKNPELLSKANGRTSSLSRRKSTSQAVPSSLSSSRRVPTRSASVASTYSTASTYDSRMGDSESTLHGEMNEMRKLLQEALIERDAAKIDVVAKKEEIQALRDKLALLRRELSEVTTSKGALNEACVSGMMDAFALNAKVEELEELREMFEQQNLQLRQDAADYDRERRGLLDLLDDGKERLKEYEKMLEAEMARNQELEENRSVAVVQLSRELKLTRRELMEKTLRIKRLAQTNTRLACKLLSLDEEGVEANNLANSLQTLQQEGDNQELVNFVLQLESQTDQQLELERYGTGCDMRMQQSMKLEEERATLLNSILSLEESLKIARKEVAEGQQEESELQNLLEDKAKLQSRVSVLTRDIEALKVEDKRQGEAEIRMREDYVQKLEADLHAAKGRIDELSKMLKGARVSENESMSSQVKASEEISKLESEKSKLKGEILELHSQLKQLQDDMKNQAQVIRAECETQIQDLKEDHAKQESMIQSLEKQLAEYHRVKQETDNIVRKLKQDIREHDQQKETLAYQVNVLEWQLVGLYSDKEDAIRALADREMDIARLKEELADKDDDLQCIKQSLSEENEAQIEACELRYEKEQLEDTLTQKQRYISSLEYELEQLKKDKTIVDEHIKETKKKSQPWLRFKIRF